MALWEQRLLGGNSTKNNNKTITYHIFPEAFTEQKCTVNFCLQTSRWEALALRYKASSINCFEKAFPFSDDAGGSVVSLCKGLSSVTGILGWIIRLSLLLLKNTRSRGESCRRRLQWTRESVESRRPTCLHTHMRLLTPRFTPTSIYWVSKAAFPVCVWCLYCRFIRLLLLFNQRKGKNRVFMIRRPHPKGCTL